MVMVSKRHGRVLDAIAVQQKWTLKTTAEDAIERLAKALEVSMPTEDTAAPRANRRRAVA